LIGVTFLRAAFAGALDGRSAVRVTAASARVLCSPRKLAKQPARGSGASVDLAQDPADDRAIVLFVARNHHINLVGRPGRASKV
jgi:hypothetical protein